MPQIWPIVLYVINTAVTLQTPAPQPFQAQFMKSSVGREVTICLDGQKVERTFAGKMVFRDNSGTWSSVCANVRAPVAPGDIYWVQPMRTSKAGGNYTKAGNIVAKYFRTAQTPDQCAGLQIAVWKAIEDGSDQADFTTGHFQVRASQNVLAYATQFYQAAATQGDAVLAATNGNNNGQAQLTPL